MIIAGTPGGIFTSFYNEATFIAITYFFDGKVKSKGCYLFVEKITFQNMSWNGSVVLPGQGRHKFLIQNFVCK